MSLLSQARSAIKQAFRATVSFQTLVTFTHYSYQAVTDSYTGKKIRTNTTEAVYALVDEIRKEKTDGGHYLERTSVYVDETVLTLDLQPDDIAVFNGQTWVIEPAPDNPRSITRTLPAFVREIPVRRP